MNDIDRMTAPQPPAEAQAQGGGEVVAWLIEWRDTGASDRSSSKRRCVHLHNAIGDYRAFDPDAAVTPLYTAPPSAPVGLAEAQRLLALSQWKPIETAPKGERVLVYNPLNGRRDIVNGWEDKSIFATHWMPIPEPPSEAASG